MERGAGAGHDVFRAGEHNGVITPRTEELAAMLKVIDGARATDNLWGERWAKLSQNAMGNPVQAMTGLGSAEIAGEARGREITIRLGEESARVGLALGLRVPSFAGFAPERWADAAKPEVYREIDESMAGKSGGGRNWRASMAQDVIKGRRTEIDYMNGYVVDQGREKGVPTPVSSAVVQIVREIDAGTRKPSPDNIGVALSRSGSRLVASRMLKKAHLLRWRPRPHAQRRETTPRVRPSGAASHLDLFEQPANFSGPARLEEEGPCEVSSFSESASSRSRSFPIPRRGPVRSS